MSYDRIFYKINQQIRTPTVRLVDFDGTQIGIVPIQAALEKARERFLDLVEIVPRANPPVCKIMEYAKFKYEESKRVKDSRKKHKGGELKEIRMRPHIGEHDLDVKVRHAREFLCEHNKVRVTIIFYGREMTHRDLGSALFEKITQRLLDVSEPPPRAKMLGNRMIFIIEPAKHKPKSPSEKSQIPAPAAGAATPKAPPPPAILP
ncbi:MAG: translation initiation factor IF-3 [Endomicrobiia bacterium]|nr:translation initiation factor IF-3 [Endomicrobiia bacterium]